MPDPNALPLHEWETFYVIIGSSAAALTGLMFVVVALGAERRTVTSPEGATGMTTFGTPTVVHFCAVLLLAALVTTPRQTASTLGACLATLGGLGILYGVLTLLRARRQQDYEPVLEDWVWHFILPFLVYSGLLATGLVLRRGHEGALYAAAAAELLLLFVGIHNAWDAAVWIAYTTQRAREARESAAEAQSEPPPRPAGTAPPEAQA